MPITKADVADTSPSGAERTFFGQPRSLTTLFSVEMWERFSFYGMQGILLIYLYYTAAQGGLGVDQTAATASSARTADWCTCRRFSVHGLPADCWGQSARCSSLRYW